MIHTLKIPGYLPPRLNELLRAHWGYRARAQKEADQFVAIYAASDGVPRATGRWKVSLVFRGSRCDPDARLKLILDALVHAGLLVDDSEKWCLLDPPKNGPGPRAVVIQLEDIPPLEGGD